MNDTSHKKICLRCNINLELSSFQKHSQSGRLRNVCHQCRITQINNWQDENREQTRTNQRNYRLRLRGRAMTLLNSAAIRASNKKQFFNLTLEDVMEGLRTGICVKTGIPFSYEPPVENHHVNPFSPSIDRIDSNGIYEPSNVQYVCSWYNMAKRDMSDDLMLVICKIIAERIQ